MFETLAYAGAYALYRRLRSEAGDPLTTNQRWNIIAAAALGALAGSRLLTLIYELPRTHITWTQVISPTGGKTIVGGLLGGWIAVELVKIIQGISTRTGDLFVVPLCFGIAIGRIGCLLAGLTDDTYGKPSNLPWAVDFGDGVPRHPTQAYEIVYVAVLGLILLRRLRQPHLNGVLFRVFMAAYLAFRLAVDFLKPEPLWHGLSVIQWSCAAALVVIWMTWPQATKSMEPTYA